MYALTAIRLAGGEETPRFEAKITKDGKVVAIVSNGGTGGCCDYHWQPREEREAFMAFIKAKYPHDTFEPEDGWVYEQLDAAAELKKIVRWSKTKTVFRDASCNSGEYRILKVPYRGPGSPAGIWLKQNCPNGEVFDPATKDWKKIA